MHRLAEAATRALAPALALATLLALADPATAGPWAGDPGHRYASLACSVLSTDVLRTPDGTRLAIPDFRREDCRLYLEQAFAARLAARVELPLLSRSQIDGFGRAGGVGDIRLGLQATLLRDGHFRLGALGIVQAPTGDVNKGEGLLPTGSGAWEGDLRLSAGRSFGRGWAQLEAGHRLRGAGLRDSAVFDAQLGVRTGRRVALEANFRGLVPWRGQGAERAQGSAAGLGDGVRYLEAGPGASFRPGERWGLELGATRSFAARNLATGWTWRFGIAWSR